MAKKNLSALMSGIMGQPEPVTPAQEEHIPVNSNQDPKTVDVKPGERKRGRPRNENNVERATFIVDPEVMRQIKYICLVEGKMQKDLIDEALRRYIGYWEAQNGRIKLPNKK